jgi:hypothetical protein
VLPLPSIIDRVNHAPFLRAGCIGRPPTFRAPGGFRVWEGIEATISEVALLELGCREGDDLATFFAEHEAMIEDLVLAAGAKWPGPPVRVWANDVRRREATTADGLGGPPVAWK